MIRVALIGANGYVGRALCDALAQQSNYAVTAVTRANYAEIQELPFDILVNAAMPSQRFWAKSNPRLDFIETVQKTADLLYGWQFRKFVQISTLSARCQLDTVYGRHKAAAEGLCTFRDCLIVRLGPMYSRDLNKGVLVDMLTGGKVFVHAESKYCFAHRDFVTGWIATNLDRSGIVEVGARNTVRLREVAERLGVRVEFEGNIDHQEIENPDQNFPDARDVFQFLDKNSCR